MARNKTEVAATGQSVLVVDDSQEFLAGVQRLIARDGHRVLTASSGRDALTILRDTQVDLVLVDYLMPGMTGEQFVTELRMFNPVVQVILQTGYASQQPPREMLRRLDIQGYHDKNDGPDKLMLWVDVGLKSARAQQHLLKSRQGLRYILSVTPELHKLQPIEQLLQGVLLQTAGLLGAANAFLAVAPAGDATGDGFVAVRQVSGELVIRAGAGRFEPATHVAGSVPTTTLGDIDTAMRERRTVRAHGATIVPLTVGDTALGVIYVDRPALDGGDLELLEIFGNQAAVAIQNVGLYEIAALDPLTGAYGRRFIQHALLRAVRAAQRTGKPLGVLMVDLDKMKRINDVSGHLGGDRALVRVARVLKEQTRGGDAVGRYGGDEFLILLPNADAIGTEIVAQRIRAALPVLDDAVSTPIGASVGGATLGVGATAEPRSLAYFRHVATRLIARADERLYAAKRRALDATGPAILAWPAVADAAHADSDPPGGAAVTFGLAGFDEEASATLVQPARRATG